MIEAIEYVPEPGVIEATCKAFQDSWTDEQRDAAWRGLPRQSSPIVLASPQAQERLARGRVWHAARRQRMRVAKPGIDTAERNVTHYPDIQSDLKWEARFSKVQRLPDGRQESFGRRKVFATREEAVEWRRQMLAWWERRQAEACRESMATSEG